MEEKYLLEQEACNELFDVIATFYSVFGEQSYILSDIFDDYGYVLKDINVHVLYYLFPLVERLLMEILSLMPEADIERYDKRDYRTFSSMFEKNEKIVRAILKDPLFTWSKELFISSQEHYSLRDQISHSSGLKDVKVVDVFNLKKISIALVIVLESMSKDIKDDLKKPIEYIK